MFRKQFLYSAEQFNVPKENTEFAAWQFNWRKHVSDRRHKNTVYL